MKEVYSEQSKKGRLPINCNRGGKKIALKIQDSPGQILKMPEHQQMAKSIEKFLNELDARIRARYPLISHQHLRGRPRA